MTSPPGSRGPPAPLIINLKDRRIKVQNQQTLAPGKASTSPKELRQLNPSVLIPKLSPKDLSKFTDTRRCSDSDSADPGGSPPHTDPRGQSKGQEQEVGGTTSQSQEKVMETAVKSPTDILQIYGKISVER